MIHVQYIKTVKLEIPIHARSTTLINSIGLLGLVCENQGLKVKWLAVLRKPYHLPCTYFHVVPNNGRTLGLGTSSNGFVTEAVLVRRQKINLAPVPVLPKARYCLQEAAVIFLKYTSKLRSSLIGYDQGYLPSHSYW